MKAIKIFFLLFVLALLASPAAAQSITKTFAWDASTTTSTPENPIRYKFYVCPNQTYTNCTIGDAGTALEFQYPLVTGVSYVYVTAWYNALTVDGVPTSDVLESGKSNILKLEVRVPPGNPGNARIKVTQIAGSASGQTLK